MTRGLPWVKISKVMPLPKSIPPGKGGKPYGKKSKPFVQNMVRLNRTYYSHLNFKKGKSPNLSFKTWYGLTIHIIRFYISQANFFKIGSFGQNSSELRKFCAICPHSPRIPRNLHYSLTYTLCFRHLPRQRTLRNSSELRKFHEIRPQSPRIT